MKPSARRRAQRRKAAKARARTNVAKRTLAALGDDEPRERFYFSGAYGQTGGTGGWVEATHPYSR